MNQTERAPSTTSPLYEAATALCRALDREAEIATFTTGTKRKTVWYHRVRRYSGFHYLTDGRTLPFESETSINDERYKTLEELANAMCWELACIFEGARMSQEYEQILDRVETLLEDWQPQFDPTRVKAVIVIVRSREPEATGEGWAKFVRDVKQVNAGVGIAQVLYREVQVRFDETRGVWFEIV